MTREVLTLAWSARQEDSLRMVIYIVRVLSDQEKTDTYILMVSLQKASRYGRATSASYGISFPYCSCASMISALNLSCTSL